RAYLFRDGGLIQLTRDHTHAIRRRTARSHLVDLSHVASDLHHILTDVRGAGTVDPHIDIERVTLADEDLVLLCSNGLTDVVDDGAIALTLARETTPQARCDELIERAVAGGAHDDATVLLARYHVPE